MSSAKAAGSAPGKEVSTSAFNVHEIRKDFPILHTEVHGKPLVYLDNAASTQKPQCVIDKVAEYYSATNANIHRGVHLLSQKATLEYEGVREKLAAYLNASSSKEIIFTRGTTEAINLVAYSYGRKYIHEGDEIIISYLEHHSNIVPWQMLCEEKKAVLKVIRMDDNGDLDMDHFHSLLSEKTKFISVVHVSNALGTVNPVEEIIRAAKERGIPVLVDGAQSVQHQHIDVRALGCDFFVFSAHKLYAPTGVGVLYGRKELLEKMPPYQGGGDMIASVSFEKTTYNELPYKFEAGTPNIEGVIGLGPALDYIQKLGFDAIQNYENDLLVYTGKILRGTPGVKLLGEPKVRSSVYSFQLEGIHPHDTGTILDLEGVAIRTGHHCAQPVMKRLGVPATARVSISFYNTKEEIDYFALSLQKVFEVFK
ncbi:MAG: cysteine desulfurase [Ignavibacteriaceae bacterium]|nr:cysteine desulfurase [Ignavibacteriaceae bacterium]